MPLLSIPPMGHYTVWCLVFLSMVLVDLFWAIYIRTLAQDKLLTASVFSSLIVLLGAFTTFHYVKDVWLIVPTMAGAFVGTYISKRVENFIARFGKS